MDANEHKEMQKIGFKLQRDEDDYPPADWEWMWAKPVSGSTFKIDNIPFFATGVSSGDVVEAEQTKEGLIFRELVEPSGHSTVRVIIFRGDQNNEQLQEAVEGMRQSLKALGCATELSHIPNLIAVDVPPEVDYRSVTAFLSQQERDGILEFEEASLT